MVSHAVGLVREGVSWEQLSEKKSTCMSVVKWTSFPGKGIVHEGMREKIFERNKEEVWRSTKMSAEQVVYSDYG